MSLSRTSHQRTLRGGKTPRLENVPRQWRTSIPCLFLLLCYSPALADDPAQTAKLVAAGDTALQNGDVSSALESYTQIPSPSDETIYNLGVAYYRNENLPLAAEQFRKVLSSQNDAVAAKARFNLGNTLYANALAAIAEPATNTQATAPPETSKRDVETGIKFLRSAITQYRSSLRINNSDTDARANIELAQRLIQQLQQDQEQQDQEQQDQEQQDQEQQDQEQQDQEQQDQEQQDQEQQDQEQQDQEQQDQEQQDQEQQDQEQQDQEQQDQQQQDQQQQDQQQQDQEQQDQQQQDQEQQDQEQQDQEQQDQEQQDQEQQDQQQQDQQQQDQEQQDQQQPDSDEMNPDPIDPKDELDQEGEEDESDTTPSGELTAVNETTEQSDEKPEEPVSVMSDRMTEEEARKLLQSIRDRDMLRRLRRQAADRALRMPVERDW